MQGARDGVILEEAASSVFQDPNVHKPSHAGVAKHMISNASSTAGGIPMHPFQS